MRARFVRSNIQTCSNTSTKSRGGKGERLVLETRRRLRRSPRLVRFPKVGLSLVLIVAIVLSYLSFAFGAPNFGGAVGQTGTVVITVANYPPEMDGLRIGGNNVTEVNVNTVYSWVVTLSDRNSLKNLESVTIYLHRTNSSEGVFDVERSYGFRWLRGDVWQELTAKGWSNSTTYLNLTQSSHSQISTKLGQGEWRFAARLCEKALYSGNPFHWFFEAVARDRAGAEGYRSIVFDVHLLVSIPQEGVIQANAALTGTGGREKP
jgi:hypothetical protein